MRNIADELDLFPGSTFMPDDKREVFDALLEAVWRKRFTTFVTVSTELQAAAPTICVASGFSDASLAVMSAPAAYRRALIGDPAFLIWLNLATVAANEILTGTAKNKHFLRRTLGEFSAMRQRFDDRRRVGNALEIPGTRILVQRFDIDPLIAHATPPSYRFTSAESRRQKLSQTGYSIHFFKDVATVAFDRIERTWPECHRLLDTLVRVLGYVPDASFRSCSASRYTGVIYLAARENSILEIEESLVHEAGHQLLYTLVETQCITRKPESDSAQYTLPWSGQLRDFYGYFHAFYIYVLLVKYFERVVALPIDGRSDEERGQALERMIFILNGLIAAVTDFRDNENFTPHGRVLFRSLESEIEYLAQKHKPSLEGSGNGSSVATNVVSV